MWLGMWLGLASIPLVDDMQIFEKCSCIENAASVGSWEPIREAHHCSCSKRAHLHLTLTTVTRAENFKAIKLWGRLLQRAKMNSYSSDAYFIQFSSVAQSCPTLCDPMDCSTARLHCPSPTSGVYSVSCPLSWWCHPAISSSIVPFSSHLQSFPASGSFPISQFFASSDLSIGVSASTSALLMNIQDWFPLEWTGWIFLQSKGLSRVFPTPQFKSINSSVLSFLYSPPLTSIHDYWKNHSFD